jgi:hypothetical protein
MLAGNDARERVNVIFDDRRSCDRMDLANCFGLRSALIGSGR